jgi:tRNA-modifying protein YgfZ
LFRSAKHLYSVPEMAIISTQGQGGHRQQSDPPPAPAVCPLPWAVCLAVSGADATTFLRAQLSRNPPQLTDNRAPLATWNDPRGRVRALFRLVAYPDRHILIAERETADAVVAKLRMFVLRAKVELSEAQDWQVVAVVGDATALLASMGVELSAEPGTCVRAGDRSWLRIGPHLIYLIGPRPSVAEATAGLVAAAGDSVELAHIRLGLPRISSAVADLYLPQMLNLDRLDAIAFDKGCYPGQEVIARLHHLGSVKRRMRRFSLRSTSPLPAAGVQLVDAQQLAVGEVVRAASADGATEILAVVQLAALGGPLFLSGPPQLELTLEDLPYDDS